MWWGWSGREARRPQVGTWVGGQEACDGTPGASTPVFLALWDLTCGPSPGGEQGQTQRSLKRETGKGRWGVCRVSHWPLLSGMPKQTLFPVL